MRRRVLAALSLAVAASGAAAPAAADHTDPREPLAPIEGSIAQGISRGDGTWQHLANFPGLANPALTGGGTDLEFFRPGRGKTLYGSFGTLGQDEAGSIGQRIIRLVTAKGKVRPKWVADHGSAHCPPASTSVTGLQHDVQVGKRKGVTLLTDTTDATGRCHDPGGGGIEIVDVTKIRQAKKAPREIHLLRFPGFTHTNTIDRKRPWIVYSSSSDFDGRPWIDVVNMKSCFGKKGWSHAKRRSHCHPRVSRIQLQPEWTQQRDSVTGQLEPGNSACHDITYKRKRLYCAAPNATVILNVNKLVKRNGQIRGTSLPCPVIAGTHTKAKVTDCSGMGPDRTERATGWRLVGFYNNPGRDCVPGDDVRTCNSNNLVRADAGIAVGHEADPTPDGRFMFVTDERGGGIVPPGSSCAPGLDNPFGNGGAHAFDISDPSNIKYATTKTGEKSVYISDAVVPAETFCDIHVIEQVPGEQRIIAAYYSQGIKIVDYFVDDAGHLQFEERASFTLPNANTWAAEHFEIRRNDNGTRTYYIAANDIHRGVDVVSWTGPPNPVGAEIKPQGRSATDGGLVAGSVLLLGFAVLYRRRRLRAVAAPA
jgi:hypothetical protein